MLPSNTKTENIEAEVKSILESKDGWLRVEECAKVYAKGNGSKRTKFYRWRKKVGKDKVEGFQIVELPKNISFIGLASADPTVIKSLFDKDKNVQRSVRNSLGFFGWLDRRAERKAKNLLSLKATCSAHMEAAEIGMKGGEVTEQEFKELERKYRKILSDS